MLKKNIFQAFLKCGLTAIPLPVVILTLFRVNDTLLYVNSVSVVCNYSLTLNNSLADAAEQKSNPGQYSCFMPENQ